MTTPTRYGYTYEVQLHLRGTATLTRYSYTYEVQLHLRGTTTPTRCIYIYHEIQSTYEVRYINMVLDLLSYTTSDGMRIPCQNTFCYIPVRFNWSFELHTVRSGPGSGTTSIGSRFRFRIEMVWSATVVSRAHIMPKLTFLEILLIFCDIIDKVEKESAAFDSLSPSPPIFM